MQFSSSLLRSPGKGEQRSVKAVCVYVCVCNRGETVRERDL